MNLILETEPKESILESSDFTELIDVSILNQLINSTCWNAWKNILRKIPLYRQTIL